MSFCQACELCPQPQVSFSQESLHGLIMAEVGSCETSLNFVFIVCVFLVSVLISGAFRFVLGFGGCCDSAAQPFQEEELGS